MCRGFTSKKCSLRRESNSDFGVYLDDLINKLPRRAAYCADLNIFRYFCLFIFSFDQL